MKKNSRGQVIVDRYKPMSDFVKGRKNKKWFLIDGEKYLFKESTSNYEAWAEVLSYYLAEQCNIESAHYMLATYQGKSGVLTKSFLSEGDIILSGDVIMSYSNKIIKENNYEAELTNSVEGVLQALSLLGYNHIDFNDIWYELIRRWAFDGLIMESDRNSSNWSFIKNQNDIRLSPIYDTSTIGRMNNNVMSFINGLKHLTSINELTDNIHQSFTLYSDDPVDDFLASFARFCAEYPEIALKILELFKNINVDKAIFELEDNLNQDKTGPKTFFPWECSIWLNKIIKARLDDMEMIYDFTLRERLNNKSC